MADKRILIVEDDLNLGQILKEYLELKGYETDLCRDGEQGVESFKNQQYDLCILDIMMPKKDGFSVAKDIRTLDKKTPFIFLTAKNLKEDTIEGFKVGADDYITKPFSMEELLLRLEAIIRRTNGRDVQQVHKTFEFSDFTLYYDQQRLIHPVKEYKLTSKEADLLLLLVQNMNEVLERSVALKMIWRDDSYFNARSMDVYIAKLRKYLKIDDSVKIITIHGQGFKLVNLK